MPLTQEQIAELAPKLARAYNFVDNFQSPPTEQGSQEQRRALALAAFDLIRNLYKDRTLEFLIQAFPAYTFLQALTVEELQPLAGAVKVAYDEDVDAHHKNFDRLATFSAKS
mgnify:CR=1 FL=1